MVGNGIVKGSDKKFEYYPAECDKMEINGTRALSFWLLGLCIVKEIEGR